MTKSKSPKKTSSSPDKIPKEAAKPVQTDKILELAQTLNDLIFDLPPRNIRIKLRYVINLQKGGTLPFMLFLMYYYQNFAVGPWIYLALHGTYGLIWLAKDFSYGDSAFDFPTGLGSSILSSSLLLGYWFNGYSLMSGIGIQNPSPERVCLAIFSYLIGAILMAGSDLQKNLTLKFKKGLISNGFQSYTRNPNYLGEILIYASFTILTGNEMGWAIQIFAWSTLFAIRMLIKEASYQKKEGWEQYSARSYMLLPKVYGSHFVSLLVYLALIGGGYFLKQYGGLSKLLIDIHKMLV